MSITLTLEHTVHTHTSPTPRVAAVAQMFGLGVDDSKTVKLIPPTQLTLGPGKVVFITGTSGGGKTTLLRLIREGVEAHQRETMNGDESHVSDPRGVAPSGQAAGLAGVGHRVPDVFDFDDTALPGGGALIDGFPVLEGESEAEALKRILRLLGRCGLHDAFVMLRKPAELSAGQRYRLRLAHTMARVEAGGAPWPVVLVDELGAALDRPTARAVSRGLRRWATRQHVCIVAATTHEDLLEALAPDVLIEKGPGGELAIAER